MKYKAITLRTSGGRFMEITSKVGASKAIVGKGTFDESQTTFWTTGLWDTGASHSSASKETADILGLSSLGETSIDSIHGEALASFYMVSLNLPNLLFLSKVRVTECANNDVFGVIIGMDSISQGDFAITNVNGVSTFSFCVPGIETIDYVERIEQRKV